MQENVHINDTAIKAISTMALAGLPAQETKGTFQVILPPGHSRIDITKEIEAAQPHPNRKTSNVTLSNLDSFILYAQEQKSEDTGYIYADPEKRTLTAVFNDNRDSEPGWRDHRAVYTAELSREFALWLGKNRIPMEQEEFAIFLEENIADVQEPSGDALMAVAGSLQAKTEASFSSAKRLDNGQVQFSYTETIAATSSGGALEVPREFAIGMRLFKNGAGFKVRARLKYRLNGGKLKFWYELDRPENAIEMAFAEYVTRTSDDSGYVVLFGKA